MDHFDDDPLAFADSLWGEPITPKSLPCLSAFDDPEAFFEENVRTHEPVKLHDDPATVLALVGELLPEIPLENVNKRLAEDPIGSVHGLQEMVQIISRKLRSDAPLNRSELLFYECLRSGGVPPNHPALLSGNNAGGSDELRWCGYIVKRPSPYDRQAVLLPCPRGVRTTPTGSLLREIRNRDQDQCTICGSRTDLQVDHRHGIVEGGGDESAQRTLDAWQILCRACNCEKRTACGRCPNKLPNPAERQRNCMSCFWANREGHTHVAMAAGRAVRAFLPVAQALEVERFIGELIG